MRYPSFMHFWLGLVLAVAACTKSNNNIDCSDRPCPDPAYPYCDVEGAVSGEPGTCIAVSCSPGELKTCVGSDALQCNTDGNGYTHLPCELGCVAAPSPHCGYIEPRYLPDVCDSPAEGDLALSSSGEIDPNLDVTCNGGIVVQQGAPSICVLHYRNISIAPDAVVHVKGMGETATGTLGNAIALVADDAVSIEGTLDISGHGVINGPGGGLTISGGPMQVMSSSHVAGGGSGGKVAGAAGGSSTADGGGNNGGLAMGDPALLAALIGGAAAWRGTTMTPADGNGGGGGGGGAAVLVACRGSVSISGAINAGGGGGQGGFFANILGYDVPVPGYGGGAGGYVVLQGQHVTVTGGVFANGGGGGAGMTASNTTGQQGEDGSPSTTFASRGGLAVNGGGRGGDGGVGTKAPTVGGKPTMYPPATAGGGGGSVGFLQTYTPSGIAPELGGAQASPGFQPNGMLKTR